MAKKPIKTKPPKGKPQKPPVTALIDDDSGNGPTPPGKGG